MKHLTISLFLVALAFGARVAHAERLGADWLHPLAAGERKLPELEGSRFGAPRSPGRPSECRGGHCGVDLYAAPGTPVVAVAPGVVTKVVRGAKERGGRYVQIGHDRGVLTYYMHLDAVREDLVVGSQVKAGDCIGTLGKTGIRRSSPHLHFAITTGRGEALRHVNPERYLRTAPVLDPYAIATPTLVAAASR